MSTKGPSNRYGTTKGSKGKTDSTSKINYPWAKDFSKNSLNKHFNEHGNEFNCKTKEEYAAKAVHFANTINKNDCKSEVDKNGTTYKWSKTTGEMALITKEGYVVSYSHMAKSNFHYTNKKGEKIWIKLKNK